MTESIELPEPGRDHVTVVLVTHDGERWLPRTLAGLYEQTRPWQRLAVADTGSTDGTLALLRACVPAEELVQLPRITGYGAAVKRALAHAETVAGDPGAAPDPTGGQATRWLWLLHDDSEPEPDALEQLLAAAHDDPGLGIVGPKIRGWYDRRVLLEVGVSIDGGGRRETFIERGEQDQGQHDKRRETLAVASAGMLVRRDVWDTLDGFDPLLPLMRDDVDLCWRAWLAGHRVAVVPAAVVHHAEAAASERRRIDAGSGRLHHLDRAGALRVLLANLSTTAFLLALPRLLVGSLLRTLGYLVAKVPRDAADELLAVGTVLIRPRAVLRMRRARRETHKVRAGSLRRLFPRPGHQFALAREALAQAIGGRQVHREAIGRHRAAAEGADGGTDGDELGAGGALFRWLLRSPGVLLVLGLSVAALLAERHLFGAGRLFGGALLPAPDSLGNLWSNYTASWHPVGPGSPTGAPPYLGLLAIAGILTGGHVGFLVGLALLAAVPLAGLCAYLASSGLPTSRALRVWGSASYALAPVLTGAVAAGRLGSALAVAALPLLGRAAVRVVGTPTRPGEFRAAWAAALLLAVLTAFAPLTWLLAGLAAAGVVLAAPNRVLRRRVAVAIGAPLVLLLPWSGHLLRHPSRLLTEPGPTGPGLSEEARSVWKLLLLNPGGPGAGPGLLGLGTVAAGLVGLAVARRRVVPLIAWAVAIAALLVALVGSRISVAGASGGHPAAAWPGVAVAAAHAAILVAAVVGCRDLPGRIAARDFGLVQPAAALLVLAAVAAPVVFGGTWLWHGAQAPLRRGTAQLVPANVAAESDTSDRPRTLVLHSVGAGQTPAQLSYVLVRGAGPRLGAVDYSVPAAAYAHLRVVVADLVSGRGDQVAQRLADFAVRYVEVRAPIAPTVAAALDSVAGLERLSRSGGDGLWRLTLPTARLALLGPPGTPPIALPSGEVSATARVPSGPPGRLLALAEPAGTGWQARLNGVALPSLVRAGWAQAWELPAAGGTVTIRHPGRLRALEVLGQGTLLILMIVLALPAASRRPTEDEDLGAPAPVPRHAHADELLPTQVALPDSLEPAPAGRPG